jgi:hypothetical protein
MKTPPAHLAGSCVLQYVVLEPQHRATKECRHVVGGREPIDIKGLAVVRDESSGGCLLLYCDSAWSVLTDTWHETVVGAVSQANFEFAGIEKAWTAFQHPGT